ncbi:MAG: inositol monophosphatase family protein [Nakamurella sp.]
MITKVDPDALLDLAMRGARAAGTELMNRYGHIQGLDSKTSATDPVSDADRAAEAILVDLITSERPDDGVLGEEGAARESTSGIRWVIDPLDGTVNYLYQLDNFSVSVAAEDADGALVGVVYNPTNRKAYHAIRGVGAAVDGRPLRVNEPVQLDRALVATGFGYSADRRRTQGALVAQLLPKVRDIRRIGSAALDLCAVAAGAVDGYFEEGVQAWDVAAGGLIAREAGAKYVDFTPTGAPSGCLAAGPALFEQLLATFAEFRSDGR